MKTLKLCPYNMDTACIDLKFADCSTLHFESSGEMVRVPIYQIQYADVFGESNRLLSPMR